MRRVGLVAVAVGLLLGADEPKKGDAKKDAEALKGTWAMVSVTRNGEEVPEEFTKTARLVVEGDTYTVTLGDQVSRSTFKVDPSKSPKQVDFTVAEGPQKDQTLKGIYELDGDTFRMCRALAAEGDRPAKFAAPNDSGLLLVVWKRAKPAAEEKPAALPAEREKLKGTWKSVSYALDGKETAAELLANVVITIDADGAVTGKNKDTVFLQATTAIDPSKSPKTLDLTFTAGPHKGETSLGIYELNGDTFRVCRANSGLPRPTEFSSTPGSGRSLMTYRRASSADPAAVAEELKRFEGTWRFASVESGGKPVPLELFKGAKLELKGSDFSYTDTNGVTHGTFRVDPAATPKTIEITFTDGPEKGQTLLGVYELTPDTYKVCLDPTGKDRPKELATQPGSGVVLEVLKKDSKP